MGITFMLLASLTPFMFLHIGKYVLGGVQSLLTLGMWFYLIEAVFFTAPSAFSVTWLMFYASLILAEVAWVQFIIRIVENAKQYKTYRYTNYRAREILE